MEIEQTDQVSANALPIGKNSQNKKKRKRYKWRNQRYHHHHHRVNSCPALILDGKP